MNDWRSYDEVAETYERVHAPRLAEPARDLVALAEPAAGARMLDVGTGTGVAAQAAAAVVGESGLAVGVDRSVGMMLAGRRARPGLRLAGAEAIDLPFRDQVFDAVTGNFVISHFTRYETALFDILRVMKSGARLALSSWSDGEDELQKTWGELVDSAVEHELLEGVWAQAAPWHDRFRDRGAFEQTLIDAGLRHVRTEPMRYHFRYSVDEYVEGLETWAVGRFVREMLGPQMWESFRARARDVFRERFADPLNDFRDVLLAVGTKP